MHPQPQQAPPKQITYPVAAVAVQPEPGGSVLLIFSTPFEQVVFPMSADAAESIGKALSAPRVVVPPAGNGKGLL